jgi:DNA sulfur modification protein DndE
MLSSAFIRVHLPSSAVKNLKPMEPPVDRIRLSQTGKDQLSKLKRSTKIDQWNILCRWGFCRSLAEPSIPSPVPIPSDSNVELSCLHLHRGIGYLAGDPNIKKIEDLVAIALSPEKLRN